MQRPQRLNEQGEGYTPYQRFIRGEFVGLINTDGTDRRERTCTAIATQPNYKRKKPSFTYTYKTRIDGKQVGK